MIPLNRDDDARRLFTRPKLPLWVRLAVYAVMMAWLYVVGQLLMCIWRAF